jgi:hypothetical protein
MVFQAATRRLPASHEVKHMRKLAITLAVSTTLGLVASAVAALPTSGPFTGKTSLHPVNGFPDVITFVSANGGHTLKKFTFGTLGCFGSGSFPVGTDPYGMPDSTAVAPVVTVAANGTFLLAAAKVKFSALDAADDPLTTATIKGTFTSAKAVTGTITISQSQNGDKCGPSTMKFTAQPGTPASLGYNGP